MDRRPNHCLPRLHRVVAFVSKGLVGAGAPCNPVIAVVAEERCLAPSSEAARAAGARRAGARHARRCRCLLRPRQNHNRCRRLPCRCLGNRCGYHCRPRRRVCRCRPSPMRVSGPPRQRGCPARLPAEEQHHCCRRRRSCHCRPPHPGSRTRHFPDQAVVAAVAEERIAPGTVDDEVIPISAVDNIDFGFLPLDGVVSGDPPRSNRHLRRRRSSRCPHRQKSCRSPRRHDAVLAAAAADRVLALVAINIVVPLATER